MAVVAVPAVLAGALIARYAVNTRFSDEWELVPVLGHLHAGHFVWQDFWAQHREHRALFPVLLLAGLAQLDSWNIVAECFASLVVAVLAFLVLARAARRTGIGSFGVLLVFSLIWFSPVQWENWLWGWEVEWFLNVLGVTMVVWALSCRLGARLDRRGLAVLVAGGVRGSTRSAAGR